MRNELTDYEWTASKAMLPKKVRAVSAVCVAQHAEKRRTRPAGDP
jgi:hypothetical protein